MNSDNTSFKSAFIALIGRPNSGKSTLLNTLLNQRLSIVTPLPQTTRKNIRGIYNDENLQLVFIDTPGIHKGKHSFNETMYKQSIQIVNDEGVDLFGYIVDLSRPFGQEEDRIATLLGSLQVPLYIIFNKTDLCQNLDETIQSFFQRYPDFKSCNHIAVCALSKTSKDLFLTTIKPSIPHGPKFYPEELFTDSNLRFLASEIIRKQIIDLTSEEVPHAVYVEILSYQELEHNHTLETVIHVETQGQKGIVIGRKGRIIVKIKQRSQRELEHLIGKPARITCHVVVSPKWRDNKRFLSEMGLDIF